VAVAQCELGDVAIRFSLPHGGDQLAYLDLLTARPTRRHSFGQAVSYGLDSLRRRQSCPQMLFWRPARLAVDDSISGQVRHELGSYPAQARRRLQDRNRLIESFQVTHQRSRVRRLGEPAAKIIGGVSRQYMSDVGGQLDDRLRP
jgi:hypothetical protein